MNAMMDEKSSWRPIWIRGGKIEHATWIGKDVLAWCLGMHIVFYNVLLKRESLRWSSKKENGDGVSCLSGHSTIQVLAFADKSFRNQKISVLSYPSMKTVSECIRSGTSRYLATAFTSTDHLISLDSYPPSSVTIWSWRTGDRLVSVDTPIQDLHGQIIEVSNSKPAVIAQLGRTSGRLQIWELSPAGKTIFVTGHDITLPGTAIPYHMSWSLEAHEPQLAIIDNFANIYISNHDGSQVLRTVLTQRCGICLDYEAPSVRWFRDGIILRTTFCQIRFYKKDAKNSWHKEWYVKSILKPTILSVHPSKNSRLFYHSHEGFLMELEIIEGQENPAIERRLHCGSIYNFVESVHPWGHYLLAIDDTVELSILNCYDGREVARLDLEFEGEVMQLLSHPDYPMAAAISKEGELTLLSLYLPENPFVIAKFRLQRERLDLLKFSQCGKYLVVGQRTSGVCYCLSLTRNKPFDVISRLDTKCRMNDVLLYDAQGRLKLFVLVVSSKKVTVGHHMILYEVPTGEQESTEPVGYLELPYSYQSLHYAPEGGFFLIATLYLSRQLHLLEIIDYKQINLVDAVFTGHEIRRARLYSDRSWITSSAFDGQVTLRNGKTRKLMTILQTHHRSDLGVKKAVAKASGDVVVSLGYNGSLVAMRSKSIDDPTSLDDSNFHRVDYGEYERKRNEILSDHSSLHPNIIEILSKRLDVFPSVKNSVEKTWFEWKREAKMLEEKEAYSQARIALQSDFMKLTGKIAELLDINEAAPAIEKLPIATFNLNKAIRDSRLRVARDEREDARLEMEASCVSMDRVTSWIKFSFWNSQKIIGRSIFAIFDDTEVTNYATMSDDRNAPEMLQLARFFKDSMRNVIDVETFFPWKLYSPSQLQMAIRRKFRLNRLDEKQRMDAILSVEDEEDREMSPDEIEDHMATEGITTHHFIGQYENYYPQFECYGFSHLLLNSRYFVNDCKILREYFNKLFDDVFSAKEREMSVIRERHERIRYIDSELKILFDRSVTKMPIDPQWNWKEQPDNIARVLDGEMKVKPYVSPSQQELLDKQALEAERLRQLLLSDDFRERALIMMMDGVLEVRWEDTIKRDITKPQCMLTKEPDQYNAEDLLAVRQYEKDVEFLENERVRYNRMLDAELTKISSVLRESIEKFNAKVHDLFSLKMRIEAAIQQLNLRNIRAFIRHVHRVQSFVTIDEMREEIAAKTKILGRLSDELRTLHTLAQEYRNHHEALVTREKAITKKFRSDFPSLGKSNVELLEKEYKRRPRTSLKNATASDLVELGRNVVARIKVPYLSHDCAEYLRNLELMDIHPAGLPGYIDNYHWDHLIRIRRTRIELEMKARSQAVELHETEKTIAAHESKIVEVDCDMDLLKERVIGLRQERIDFDLDMEIQLVLKMGQVEVRPNGRRDDMKNALLISRGEIETVNKAITHAGRGKLRAMNHTINFHRGTIFKEWEHKCLRMKIEDLEDELHMIQNVLVSRDMRELLSKQRDGHKDDKTPQQLEKELEAIRKNCQKHLKDWVVRLEDVEAKMKNIKRGNDLIDKKITRMNVERWELEWQRDIDGEMRQKEYHDRIMFVVTKRAKLVRKLHKEYTEVLALQTEHELIRLKKFPMLNFFKTLNDESGVC